MPSENLNYLGPNPKLIASEKAPPRRSFRLPLGLILVVVLPTLIASIYYLFIATPIYVSEARFIVRAANQSQPSALGVALQGVGLTSTQTDSFTVHEYIGSRDGLAMIQRRFDLNKVFGPRRADFISRYPRPFEKRSEEALYRATKRFMTVGYDSTTGVSTLRVKAYSPEEAKSLADAVLSGSEALVNGLNERASQNALLDATAARDLARAHVDEAQSTLTAFRNSQAFVDPTLNARESSELIGTLRANVAALSAERSQIAASAPSSPQLPIIDSRIEAYRSQIERERAAISGGANSLAPKIGAYEDLVKNRELADKELATASAALVTANQEARRQKIYLDRISNPNVPDMAVEPRRLTGILTVLMSCLLAYGVGWLIYAGLREHRQA